MNILTGIITFIGTAVLFVGITIALWKFLTIAFPSRELIISFKKKKSSESDENGSVLNVEKTASEESYVVMMYLYTDGDFHYTKSSEFEFNKFPDIPSMNDIGICVCSSREFAFEVIRRQCEMIIEEYEDSAYDSILDSLREHVVDKISDYEKFNPSYHGVYKFGWNTSNYDGFFKVSKVRDSADAARSKIDGFNNYVNSIGFNDLCDEDQFIF